MAQLQLTRGPGRGQLPLDGPPDLAAGCGGPDLVQARLEPGGQIVMAPTLDAQSPGRISPLLSG